MVTCESRVETFEANTLPEAVNKAKTFVSIDNGTMIAFTASQPVKDCKFSCTVEYIVYRMRLPHQDLIPLTETTSQK